MTRRTQGLLLAFTGAVLLRLTLGDAYLRYVNEWMRWPIAASGLLLMALSIGPVLELGVAADPGPDEHPHGHRDGHGGVPMVTWLLVLPGLIAFTIAPPALGSYLAERRAGNTVVAQPSVAAAASVDTGPDGGPTAMTLPEFLGLSQQGTTLDDRPVALTGFVSYDGDGGWYVTRMGISCCAADAVTYRVQVVGAKAPPRDRWVTVTGVHVEGSGSLDETGTALTSPAALWADDVVEVKAPSETYT